MQKIFRFSFLNTTLLFGLVTFLAYGLLINRHGFYWDDLAFVWIYKQYGLAGLTEYFSQQRPFRIFFYATTFPLLDDQPLLWQALGLFWRWMSGVSLYWMLCQVWEKHRREMLWATLLFLVYPGFGQQYIAVNYSDFFMAQTAAFISIGCTLWAIKKQRRTRILTGIALALSIIHLFTLEYFLNLELLRYILIWIALADRNIPRDRIKRALICSIPYLIVLGAYLYWRVFIYRFPTYQPTLLNSLSTQPLEMLAALIKNILRDLWIAGFGAWSHAFSIPVIKAFGKFSFSVYTALVVFSLAGLGLYLLKAPSDDEVNTAPARAWFASGGIVFFLAGGVFWITALGLDLNFPNDRFTLPFALGASLMIVALASFIRSLKIQVAVIALLTAFAIGLQFQNAVAYSRAWEMQKELLWQMHWRMPGLRPGTLILSEPPPINFFSDLSLTAPINWMYAPDNHTAQLNLLYYYISARYGHHGEDLQLHQPVEKVYGPATFEGSTSNALLINFDPPACLRVLDPALDAKIPLLNPLAEKFISYSHLENIIIDATQSASLPSELYAPAPPHKWCYYFEQADLARQRGDWQALAALGDAAFQTGDYPNEPSERVVFIMGYALTGRWDEAEKLSDETLAITDLMQPMLCTAWQQIADQVDEAMKPRAMLMRTKLSCK